MKKFLLIAAVMLAGVSVVKAAEVVNVPSAVGANPVFTADYGGVDYATSAFSTAYTTACNNCTGVVYGVIISSDVNPDFVDIFDTTTVAGIPGDANFMFRVYVDSSNVAIGAGTNLVGGARGTTYMLPYPIRFLKGLAFKANTGLLNKVTVLFYRRRK